MSAIRNKDTKPELRVRRALHQAGFRFRLHRKDLPGRPDIVLPKYRVAIFVHGCFWHRHGCGLFQLPQNRRQFWEEKLNANFARDSAAKARLLAGGWRVAVIWECTLRGHGRRSIDDVIHTLSRFFLGSQKTLVIRGKRNDQIGRPAKIQEFK